MPSLHVCHVPCPSRTCSGTIQDLRRPKRGEYTESTTGLQSSLKE